VPKLSYRQVKAGLPWTAITVKGSPFARAFAAVIPTPGLRIEGLRAYPRQSEVGHSGEQVPDLLRI